MYITPLRFAFKITKKIRKPIWLPIAPSKLFRIPEHTFYSPEEVVEIRRLQNVYFEQRNAIAEFLKEEFYIPATQAGGLPHDFVVKEQENDKVLLQKNDEKNKEIAINRERFFEKQFNELRTKVLDEKFLFEESLIKSGKKVDDQIEKLQSNPDSFITEKNFDRIVESAFENKSNHQFFIDWLGRIDGTTRKRSTANSG